MRCPTRSSVSTPLPSPWGKTWYASLVINLWSCRWASPSLCRKPCFRTRLIPAYTYPQVPKCRVKQIHSIGIRGVLIAHRSVPNGPYRAAFGGVLLERFSLAGKRRESSMMALLQRSGDYPAHRGAVADMHRADPWPFQKLLTKIQGFIGSMVSVLSAILLAWHWIRSREVEGVPLSTGMHAAGHRRPAGGLPGPIRRGRVECLSYPIGTAQGRNLGAAPPAILKRRQSEIVDVVARIEEMTKLRPSPCDPSCR